MTPDDKLKALFAADRPPAPDYLFQTAVAQRIAARRAWATVGALVPWGIAAAAGLWGLQPVIEPLAEGLNQALVPVAGMLGVAGATAIAGLWLARTRGRLRFRL